MGETTATDTQHVRVSHSAGRRAEDYQRVFDRKAAFYVLDELQPYCEQYAETEFEALDILMRLDNSELVQYDPLHLDSVLSSAVLTEATHGRGIIDESKVYYIPLPAKRLWTSDCGLPLWATSSFLPVGSEHRSTLIMHKRHKYPAKSRTGRWMDTRIPKPVAITSSGWWQARCYGNRDEVARLLSHIRAVGKHRHDGCGRVHKWRVEPAGFEPLDTIVDNGKLIRPVPELATEHLGIEPEGNSSPMGWTQPYWKPRNFNYAWATGAKVNGKT